MLDDNDAKALIDAGKDHEENLALMAVVNSVVIDTFGFDAVPDQDQPSRLHGRRYVGGGSFFESGAVVGPIHAASPTTTSGR